MDGWIDIRERQREGGRQTERQRDRGRLRARDCIIWMAVALDGLSKSAVKEIHILAVLVYRKVYVYYII